MYFKFCVQRKCQIYPVPLLLFWPCSITPRLVYSSRDWLASAVTAHVYPWVNDEQVFTGHGIPWFLSLWLSIVSGTISIYVVCEMLSAATTFLLHLTIRHGISQTGMPGWPYIPDQSGSTLPMHQTLTPREANTRRWHSGGTASADAGPPLCHRLVSAGYCYVSCSCRLLACVLSSLPFPSWSAADFYSTIHRLLPHQIITNVFRLDDVIAHNITRWNNISR